jgi:hypothetical protein
MLEASTQESYAEMWTSSFSNRLSASQHLVYIVRQLFSVLFAALGHISGELQVQSLGLKMLGVHVNCRMGAEEISELADVAVELQADTNLQLHVLKLG